MIHLPCRIHTLAKVTQISTERPKSFAITSPEGAVCRFRTIHTSTIIVAKCGSAMRLQDNDMGPVSKDIVDELERRIAIMLGEPTTSFR